PLRERPADIVPLASFLLARAARKQGGIVPALCPAAARALVLHRWPGNIRELDNVMQRALVIHAGSTIEAADLMFEAAGTAPRSETAPAPPPETLGEDLKDHERRLILEALDEGRGSRKYAAEK